MIYSLCHLNIPAALHYNAVGVVAVVLLAWSWIAWFAASLGKRIPKWNDWRYSSITVGIVVVVWFVLRLLPWEPFASLQV